MRRALLIGLGAVIISNAVYFLFFQSSKKETFEAHWVVYMPELEDYQRANPGNVLRSSHGYDKRYPEIWSWDGDLWENRFPYPVFVKQASQCGITDYALDHFFETSGKGAYVQFPDRFFTGEITETKAECLREALPIGYSLKKLKEPSSLRYLGWEEGALKFDNTGQQN